MTAVNLPAVLPLIGLDGIVLSHGSHTDREAGVCAMEAVAWMAGEAHSDQPVCACPVIATFLRSWNDGLPDDATRNRLLKPLLPALVGSRSTATVEERRSYLALDWLIRVHTPTWLELVEELKPHATTLRALDAIQDLATAQRAGEHTAAARAAAGAAAWAAAGAAAWAAAGAAAGAAARAAAWAAAGAAARAAAGAVAGAVAWDAAWDAAGDALAPTVTMLQASATDLVRRMLAVK